MHSNRVIAIGIIMLFTLLIVNNIIDYNLEVDKPNVPKLKGFDKCEQTCFNGFRDKFDCLEECKIIYNNCGL